MGEFKKGDKVHHAGERWTVEQTYAGGLVMLKHARLRSISVTVDAAEVIHARAQQPAGGEHV